MSKKTDGGNAFPTSVSPYGMTLRDYFAAALTGWLASFAGTSADMKPENMAIESYQFADAMIAEREKE